MDKENRRGESMGTFIKMNTANVYDYNSMLATLNSKEIMDIESSASKCKSAAQNIPYGYIVAFLTKYCNKYINNINNTESYFSELNYIISECVDNYNGLESYLSTNGDTGVTVEAARNVMYTYIQPLSSLDLDFKTKDNRDLQEIDRMQLDTEPYGSLTDITNIYNGRQVSIDQANAIDMKTVKGESTDIGLQPVDSNVFINKTADIDMNHVNENTEVLDLGDVDSNISISKASDINMSEVNSNSQNIGLGDVDSSINLNRSADINMSTVIGDTQNINDVLNGNNLNSTFTPIQNDNIASGTTPIDLSDK